MRKVRYIFLIAVLSVLVFESIRAEVKLPSVLSSHMVLQRNATIKLWGWADANEAFTIKSSWFKEVFNVRADESGNWNIMLQTSNSKEPQIIEIQSKSSLITLENILFGEVWLCSGQSNMQQPLTGYTGQPTFGAMEAIVHSANPDLRLFSVDRVGSKTPQADIEKYSAWQQATADNVANFSAVAYFFGQQLQEILDVPVGLIHTSWGGSKVEAWISREVMTDFQEVNLTDVDITKRTNHIPTALFNAMINPLTQYHIRGILWYQGESNRHEPENYKKLLPAMVKDWRERWAIGDFPFYYVQIAPYLYKNNDVFQTTENSAFMREAQLQCLDLIPNSGIAITMDIGDELTIHPPKKKEVADRLLYNALNQTYGYKTVDYAAPILDSQEIKDGGIILNFKNADKGLYTYDKLQGFEIAGGDKIFYPAIATILERNKVYVKSEKVLNPEAVRYAWRNWVEGSLYDTNLLPVSSFRTDNWDEATRSEK